MTTTRETQHIPLTGGSGFIALHILSLLLERGYTITTTVRSESKASKIRSLHPEHTSRLRFSVVPDIAASGAFDATLQHASPAFTSIIHTASPFHFAAQDIQKDLLDPAVNGTLGLLTSVKSHAPSVKRVIVTSSFAAIVNPSKALWPTHTYSEADWSPLDNVEAALENQATGYRGSKTMAEKAAWEFVEREKPNFTVSTMNPPLVLGPVNKALADAGSINTSNATILALMRGEFKDKGYPPSNVPIWVDVRDLALAHVEALERGDAENKRFFVTAGYFSNQEVTEAVRKHFPEYRDGLPKEGAEGGVTWKPGENVYRIDNSRCRDVLGLGFRGLEESVVDTVRSLMEIGA